MIDCTEIIQSVDRLGAELLSEGDYIRIKKGKYLPDSITISIGEHKREILAILKRDKQAKQAGFMKSGSFRKHQALSAMEFEDPFKGSFPWDFRV